MGPVFSAANDRSGEGHGFPLHRFPADTGAFYGNHLDKVELGRRPWRPWEVGSQTLVTALCGPTEKYRSTDISGDYAAMARA